MIPRFVLARVGRSQGFRRAYERLARVPLAGKWLRSLVRRELPPGTRQWFRVPEGIGKGLWLKLDLRYEADYLRGDYEVTIQAILRKHLKPGDAFYDVGAHLGFFSLIVARLVGSHGHVLAWEADPAVVALLREHVERNALPQIEVVPQVAWSRMGRVKFRRAIAESSRNQGAVVANSQPDPTAELIEMDALTLDCFADGRWAPTLLKIDVEGGEADVLAGAECLFRRAKPALICEVHGPEVAEKVLDWLRRMDYSFEWLDGPPYPRHLLAWAVR